MWDIVLNVSNILLVVKHWTSTELGSDFQDGRVEGHALIFSGENSKTASRYWMTID